MNNTDSKANSRRIISLITYIVITAVLTQLDQITKYVAENNLYMKNDIDIIKMYLHSHIFAIMVVHLVCSAERLMHFLY